MPFLLFRNSRIFLFISVISFSFSISRANCSTSFKAMVIFSPASTFFRVFSRSASLVLISPSNFPASRLKLSFFSLSFLKRLSIFKSSSLFKSFFLDDSSASLAFSISRFILSSFFKSGSFSFLMFTFSPSIYVFSRFKYSL